MNIQKALFKRVCALAVMVLLGTLNSGAGTINYDEAIVKLNGALESDEIMSVASLKECIAAIRALPVRPMEEPESPLRKLRGYVLLLRVINSMRDHKFSQSDFPVPEKFGLSGSDVGPTEGPVAVPTIPIKDPVKREQYNTYWKAMDKYHRQVDLNKLFDDTFTECQLFVGPAFKGNKKPEIIKTVETAVPPGNLRDEIEKYLTDTIQGHYVPYNIKCK